MKKMVMISLVMVALLGCNDSQTGADSKKEISSNKNAVDSLKKVDINTIDVSASRLVSKDWLLISAGEKDNYNMMTASWGQFGVLFSEPVITIYVRKSRHTFGFIEEQKEFVVTTYSADYRKSLEFLGHYSGRDTNKMKESGLTVAYTPDGNPYFKEANMVFECEILYYQDLDSKNISESVKEKFYNKEGDSGNYHRMYVGKVKNAWRK